MMKNNMKRKKIMQKPAKKYTYKPLSEKDVSDSYMIPKVRFRDFENYLLSTEVNSRIFERN